jgi:hypothetical protein
MSRVIAPGQWIGDTAIADGFPPFPSGPVTESNGWTEVVPYTGFDYTKGGNVSNGFLTFTGSIIGATYRATFDITELTGTDPKLTFDNAYGFNVTGAPFASQFNTVANGQSFEFVAGMNTSQLITAFFSGTATAKIRNLKITQIKAAYPAFPTGPVEMYFGWAEVIPFRAYTYTKGTNTSNGYLKLVGSAPGATYRCSINVTALSDAGATLEFDGGKTTGAAYTITTTGWHQFEFEAGGKDYQQIIVKPLANANIIQITNLYVWQISPGVTPAMLYEFNKTDYVRFVAKQWAPQGSSYDIGFKALPTTLSAGLGGFMVSEDNNNLYMVGKLAADYLWTAKFLNSALVSQTIKHGTAMVNNTQYTVRLALRPGNNILYVDDVASTANTSTVGPRSQLWERFAGTDSTLYGGFLADMYLNDLDDPANSRYYPMNEGDGNTFLCYTDPGMLTRLPEYDVQITNYRAEGWKPVIPALLAGLLPGPDNELPS